MRLAIAILNWNGKSWLEKFLPTLIKYSQQAEIYVIDNASTDDSVAWISENYPQVKQVLNRENFGFAGGYNEGLKDICADIYCLLNSDVEVTENWTEPILDLFKKDESIAAIQPKILDFKMKSKYELAMFSMPDKKKDRLDNAIAYTRTIEKDLPNTDYTKTALAFRPKLEAEKARFEKIVAEAEKRQAELTAKQKAEEAKNAAKTELKKEENNQEAIENNIEKAKKDSATVSDPNSTFRIRR